VSRNDYFWLTRAGPHAHEPQQKIGTGALGAITSGANIRRIFGRAYGVQPDARCWSGDAWGFLL